MTSLRTILVPVDFSAHSRAAFDAALALARTAESKIVLVHALHFPSDLRLTSDWWATMRAAATQGIGELCEVAEEAGVDVDSEISSDHPVEAITRAARERKADLVILGSHGHGFLRHALLGSVAARVLGTAPCPVLSINQNAAAREHAMQIRRIVVATDFSPAADAALRYARELAGLLGARLHLVHAYHVDVPAAVPGSVTLAPSFMEGLRDAAQQQLDPRAAEARSDGLEVTTELVCEPAVGALIDAAEHADADLIVMGTRGLSGLKHVLLGSVAERSVRLAPCPVLTVREET